MRNISPRRDGRYLPMEQPQSAYHPPSTPRELSDQRRPARGSMSPASSSSRARAVIRDLFKAPPAELEPATHGLEGERYQPMRPTNPEV
jgi:hypothetical protein